MVELLASPYDGEEYIPFANAQIVTFDDELSDDLIVVPMTESMASTSPSTSAAAHQDLYGAPPVIDISTQTREYSDLTSLSSTTQVDQETSQGESSTEDRNIPKAAAAGGAVMGIFFGGPFLSLILGAGSHYYSRQDGAIGDCARALGEVALVAKEKFQQVDAQHHLVDKGKEAASRTWEKMHQADREHKLQEKVGYFVSHYYALTLDFIDRHNLIERATDKFKKFLHCLTEAFKEHQHRVKEYPHNRHHHNSPDYRHHNPRRAPPPCNAYIH